MFWDRLLFLLLGAALSWVVQQYRAARSEDAALITEHIKDIEKLADSIADYWLKSPGNAVEESAAAARVRARYANIGLLYPKISEICDTKSDPYKALCLEIFSLGLGGNFETQIRLCEPDRAIESYAAASKLIHHLRLVKAELISARRFLKTVQRAIGQILGTAQN